MAGRSRPSLASSENLGPYAFVTKAEGRRDRDVHER